MARYKPNFKEFRQVLNHPMMQSWLRGQGDAIAGIAFATTHKRTSHNARSFEAEVHTYDGPWKDRAVAEIRNTNRRYGLERELGGRVNPNPERSLYHAMKAVSGGRPVARPKIVHGGSARRAKRKPFLTRSKYDGQLKGDR